MRNDVGFESETRTKYPLAFREEDELRSLALALLERALENRGPRRVSIRQTRIVLGGFSFSRTRMFID